MAQKTDAALLTQKDEIKSETTANANTAARVGQMFEDIIDSKVNVADGITREFNRAFSSELLFDKNEIDYELHELTDNITFTVAEAGNLEDQFSVAVHRIETNGERTFNFIGFDFISNIENGEILEAGTYQFFFFYRNGIASVSLQLPSFEVANLIPLTTPASFTAVAGTDPDTEIDLSWTAVPNASSLELQFSTSGGSGPWSTAIALAGGATSYGHTGLTPNTTYHYRLRAIGVAPYANSQYATTVITTEDNTDSTAPTFIFSPVDAATDIPVNGVVTITASEALRKADGTELTTANIGDVLTVKEDDGAGSDIPYTATIDAGKMVITITPNVVWPSEGDVFIQIDGVEDVNGNESTADDITFTTSGFTLADNNWVEFSSGDAYVALSNILTADDANFDIGWTQNAMDFDVPSYLFRKYITGERSLLIDKALMDLKFKWYRPGGADSLTGSREVIWEDALTTGELEIRFEYRGAIDTNDGLDRLKLFVNGVENTDKSLVTTPASWPFSIRPASAPIRFGPSRALVKDLFIRTNNGATTELFIPVMRTGLDTSGNNRHGTWV